MPLFRTSETPVLLCWWVTSNFIMPGNCFSFPSVCPLITHPISHFQTHPDSNRLRCSIIPEADMYNRAIRKRENKGSLTPAQPPVINMRNGNLTFYIAKEELCCNLIKGYFYPYFIFLKNHSHA